MLLSLTKIHAGTSCKVSILKYKVAYTAVGRVASLPQETFWTAGQYPSATVRGYVAYLQKRLSASDKKVPLRDLRYAPAWIAAILRRVAGPEER